MKLLAGILVALLLGGCMAPHMAVVTDVDGRAWRDTAGLTWINEDTLASFDLALFVRYNNRMTSDMLPLNVVVQSPDSLMTTERVTMHIGLQDGSAALQREAVVHYRRRVRFSRRGDYRFLVAPDTTVVGIEAVGICFTKSK